MEKVIFDATFKVNDNDALKLGRMINALGFAEEIQGIDELLPTRYRGLVITKCRGQVHIGYEWGTYGMRNKHVYCQDAQHAMNWLRSSGITLDMLKVGVDPCLFNGL